MRRLLFQMKVQLKKFNRHTNFQKIYNKSYFREANEIGKYLYVVVLFKILGIIILYILKVYEEQDKYYLLTDKTPYVKRTYILLLF